MKRKPKEKECLKCGAVKPISEYYVYKTKNNLPYSYCKDCCRKKGLNYARSPIGRINRLKTVYNLTQEDVDKKLAEQNYSCAICKESFESGRFHIDHCHYTNKVRGLLCRGCNLGLGLFKDNKESLIAASKYVEDIPD